MDTQKIGFFGGSFNPPSKVHINLANKLLEDGKLDKVVFVPVGNYYDKKDLIDAKHRYNMLKLAVKDYRSMKIDDIELNIKNKLYAVDIFRLISEKYKDNDIYFLMGSDNYSKMPKWRNYDEIIKDYKYIILERDKEDTDSTRIREMIKNNIDISELLHKDVIEYIKEHSLYKKT